MGWTTTRSSCRHNTKGGENILVVYIGCIHWNQFKILLHFIRQPISDVYWWAFIGLICISRLGWGVEEGTPTRILKNPLELCGVSTFYKRIPIIWMGSNTMYNSQYLFWNYFQFHLRNIHFISFCQLPN
jgi:hypothetical protein